MKLLTWTRECQGQRRSDYYNGPDELEGALVRWGMECDRDRDDIDGSCGCRRGMSTLDARPAGNTTTMRVVDVNVSVAELNERLLAAVVAGGWGSAENEELQDLAKEEAEALVSVADEFALDTVLEKRGDVFRVRRLPGGIEWHGAAVPLMDVLWSAHKDGRHVSVALGGDSSRIIAGVVNAIPADRGQELALRRDGSGDAVRFDIKYVLKVLAPDGSVLWPAS